MKTLIRTVVLLALVTGQLYLWRLYDGATYDADIGAGLITFGVTALISAVWAGWDARRQPTAIVVRTWAVVAVLFAFASSFIPQVRSGSFDWSVWRSDLLFLGLFDLFLVFVPAMVVAIVVGASRDQAPAR